MKIYEATAGYTVKKTDAYNVPCNPAQLMFIPGVGRSVACTNVISNTILGLKTTEAGCGATGGQSGTPRLSLGPDPT